MAANDDNILTLESIDEIRSWGEESFAAKEQLDDLGLAVSDGKLCAVYTEGD